MRGAVRKLVSRLILSGVVWGLLLCAPAAFAVDYPIIWTFNPAVNLLEIQTGDTVTFTVPGGHDLSNMAGQSEYDSCDFSGSTIVIPGSTIDTLSFDTAGVYYYACSVGSHCSGANMKITIVVSEAVPSVSPGYVALALAISGLAATGLVVRRRSGLSPSQ